MDLFPNSATDLTSPLGTSLVPVYGDNVQDLLNAGALNVKPTGIIVVNSIDDAANSSPGVTTLRDAINQANAETGEDLIVFERSLFTTAQTITLKGTQLGIAHNLDIIAPRDQLTGEDLVTVSGNKASRVFSIAKGTTVSLDGLIVADGLVTDNSGGGIFNSGTLTLDNSIVRNNSATRSNPRSLSNNGGAIYSSGNLTVSNSTISGNSASKNGGGIYSAMNTVDDVRNSTISGNSASYGGGIYNDFATSKVLDSIIRGNSAANSGGGISSFGTSTVQNSTITGNSAYSGGGISSFGTSTVQNSTIIGNSANDNGGGIDNTGRNTITVLGSTISGNSASRDGGGMYNGQGIIKVLDSTISANSALNGGGIYNYTGTVTLLFSTVTQNRAANGGGLYQSDVPDVFNGVHGSSKVRNTIIAANLPTEDGINPDVFGDFNSEGYNLIGDNTGSTGFGVTGDIVGTSDCPIDPRLAPLDFYGGSTQTIALLPDSPAIGAADPTVLDTDPTTDQRGLPRRANDVGSDIGAFELS